MEQKTYEVKELVESVQTHFGTGIRRNKEGKIFYLSSAKNEDGSVDKNKTRLFVTLYIAGDAERNETANFKDYALSLRRAEIFKESGINLGEKLKTPIKIRFTLTETYKDGKLSVLRELTNVSRKVDGVWTWVIQPKKQDDKPAEPEVIEITEDDLPF